MRDVVRQLLATEAAIEKLGKRGIATSEARQLIQNRHRVLDNSRGRGPKREDRRLMVGTTNAGRALTLVIEQTSDRNDWLVVTGWDSASHERRMLRG
jgi:uncharacterized DUF497 family protein